MAQPAAAARMEAIAFHLYQVVPYFEPWKTPEWLVSPLSMSEAYGLPAWMTEYSNVDRSYGTYEEAMALAQHLHYNLANGVSAYLIWNLYYPWSVGEALVHIDPNGGSAYTITPKYYTAKQYMRFVRPGAVRIEAGSDDPDVLVTAYLHDTEQTLVVVAINTAAEARTLAVATGLGALATPEVFRTSATENAAPIVPPPPDASGVQTLELPGQSVATLIWALR
jgi:glucosylceramidase